MRKTPNQPEAFLVRVQNHGYLKVEPTPSEEFLSNFYGETYFMDGKDYRPDYTAKERRSFLRQVNLRLDEASDLRPAGPVRRSLDLGCGEGWASVAMSEYFRTEVVAVDLTRHGLERHNPQFLATFFEQAAEDFLAGEADESFDIIWADHLLEHHREPERLLALIRRKLTRKGLAILTIPNDDSDYQTTLKSEGRVSTDWWISPPEHLNYFNRRTFVSLAESLQFRCKSILADFPIDWFLANPKANYVNNGSLGGHAFEAKQLLEDEIERNPSTQQRAFYRGLAEVGLGRNLTYFLGS